ncbi:hypothetical protein B0H13DRAFT_2096041 [Mycena leptocephala]|nr:hypothetical protein B0H13DRAFT_2096041 [Mycena leptocephala]
MAPRRTTPLARRGCLREGAVGCGSCRWSHLAVGRGRGGTCAQRGKGWERTQAAGSGDCTRTSESSPWLRLPGSPAPVRLSAIEANTAHDALQDLASAAWLRLATCPSVAFAADYLVPVTSRPATASGRPSVACRHGDGHGGRSARRWQSR